MNTFANALSSQSIVRNGTKENGSNDLREVQSTLHGDGLVT